MYTYSIQIHMYTRICLKICKYSIGAMATFFCSKQTFAYKLATYFLPFAWVQGIKSIQQNFITFNQSDKKGKKLCVDSHLRMCSCKCVCLNSVSQQAINVFHCHVTNVLCIPTSSFGCLAYALRCQSRRICPQICL